MSENRFCRYICWVIALYLSIFGARGRQCLVDTMHTASVVMDMERNTSKEAM